MKTVASSSYNPNWLLYNNVLLKMPLSTIIMRIENGEIDLNKRFERNNNTLWHELARGREKEHAEKIKALIIHYFSSFKLTDLNSLNNGMLTPIQIAAYRGNLETISVFISFGVDPTTSCRSDLCPGGTLVDLFKLSGQGGLKQLNELLENYQGIQALQQQQCYERTFIERNTLPADAVNKKLKNSFGRSIYGACRQFFFNKEQTIQQCETEPGYSITPDDSQRPLIEKKLL